MPEVLHSETETRRFDRRVGRLTLSEADVAAFGPVAKLLAEDDHDLVIVRYPSACVEAFERVSQVPDCTAIYADTLLYFEWRDDGAPLNASDPIVHRGDLDVATIPSLVSEIFTGYRNHYSANSRLDPTLVAVGYGEWAASVALHPDSVVVATRAGDTVEGLAVIDASADVWDVVLAGVLPTARGRGVYGQLMTDVVAFARAAGEPAVRISTQSHNVQVMRTWERQGWRLLSATVTVHLERASR